MGVDASPGPIAEQTFETYFRIAAVSGAVALVVCYWIGLLSPSDPFHVTTTLTLFPVYLLFVAILLGVWLGYATDERNLTPIAERDESDVDDTPDYRYP
ncbi:hypothetical protein BRD08_11160 [Halobacteriales archaeon SW_10_66_29]|nr:MAG: hypothetical protein BRD08_11160 [Halobacteriales archaeon SW_10_66_29]